eukprot:194833-Rhodomonas_salina.1
MLVSCSARPNPKQLLASATPASENAMFSQRRRYGRKALQENAGKVFPVYWLGASSEESLQSWLSGISTTMTFVSGKSPDYHICYGTGSYAKF